MKSKIKYFLTGFIFALTLFAISTTAFAQSTIQTIKVAMGGIQIFVDGQIKKPTDANGNIVEPLIYNGTTYLPVRALTDMLTDKDVTWDAESSSIYIGARPTSSKVVLAEDVKLLNGSDVATGNDAKFKLLDKEITPFNAMITNISAIGYTYSSKTTYSKVFILDSDYKSLQGEFVTSYESLGSTYDGTLSFYAVDSYGTETLIKEYSSVAGDQAIEVSVPLTGVNYLKVEYSYYGTLYNVTFTPVN